MLCIVHSISVIQLLLSASVLYCSATHERFPLDIWNSWHIHSQGFIIHRKMNQLFKKSLEKNKENILDIWGVFFGSCSLM